MLLERAPELWWLSGREAQLRFDKASVTDAAAQVENVLSLHGSFTEARREAEPC